MSEPTPRREPAFNLPGVVLACCLVLLAIQAIRGFVSDETDDWIIADFAFVPARAAFALHVAQAQLRSAYQHLPQETIVALIGSGSGRWWSLLTYAFLHGGWLHVGFNCVWLGAFGAPVARRFAAARFLVLLAVSAVLGAITLFFWNMASFVPVVGASAAVSGVMGAATRFVFRPAGEPTRIFDRTQLEEAYRRPALTLRQTVTTRTALLFVVFWFATNLLFGLYPSLGGMGDMPVAWQAHIGGFLTGLLLFPLFDPRHPASARDPDAEDTADLPTGPADQSQGL